MVRATSKNRRNGVEARLHPMLGDSLYGSVVFLFTLRSITYSNFMAIGQVLVEKSHGECTGQRAI